MQKDAEKTATRLTAASAAPEQLAAQRSSLLDALTVAETRRKAAGDALAVALMERRGFRPQDFGVLHPGGKLGAQLRTVADLLHGPGELPLVGIDTPMRQALLVMSEKRWGIVGVTDPNPTTASGSAK